MAYSGTYAGANADTLAIKQQQLALYLGAQPVFAAGVQTYRINNRELAYIDPVKLQVMIDKLMVEIALLQNGGRRRSFAVVPRDI